MAVFYQYVDDIAEWPGSKVHVTIEYQTNAGSLGRWSRWLHIWDCESDDPLTFALDYASSHVATFKRVARVLGGSAAPMVQNKPQHHSAPDLTNITLDDGGIHRIT